MLKALIAKVVGVVWRIDAHVYFDTMYMYIVENRHILKSLVEVRHIPAIRGQPAHRQSSRGIPRRK
jgi:hypothetical protein